MLDYFALAFRRLNLDGSNCYWAKCSRNSTLHGIKVPDHLGPGLVQFWHIFGVLDFFKVFPLWNNENKSCLNGIKFWEVSGIPKASKFWRLCVASSNVEPRNLPRCPKPGPRWSDPFMVQIFRVKCTCIKRNLTRFSGKNCEGHNYLRGSIFFGLDFMDWIIGAKCARTKHFTRI